MNRTKVILSIFLMLFLLCLPDWFSPVSGKARKRASETKAGNRQRKQQKQIPDTPMPEYLDFDALKAFFSDSQIASLKGQFPVYLKEYVKKNRQASPSCRKKPATLPKQPSA